MWTIAGGIILAIVAVFAILIVVSTIFQFFTRKHPYSPPTFLGKQPSAEELRRKYGVDRPSI